MVPSARGRGLGVAREFLALTMEVPKILAPGQAIGPKNGQAGTPQKRWESIHLPLFWPFQRDFRVFEILFVGCDKCLKTQKSRRSTNRAVPSFRREKTLVGWDPISRCLQ